MGKNIALVISLFLLSFALSAETITGNCAAADQPFGKEQFQLIPGTDVDCSVPEKGWCMILFKGYIDKKYVYDGIKILSNARILDEKGKKVGKVYTDMNPYRTIEENDTCFIMEIAGYISASCIEDTSVVEHEIEKLYFQKDSLLTISAFNKHLHEFNYQQWASNGTLYSYLLKETDIINPKPGLRVIIIFDKDRAVAILHKRKLQIKTFESTATMPRYSLVYLSSFNEAYKKKIADTFLQRAEELY
jgi:hypothetical protein